MLDNLVRRAIPKEMKNMKISIEDFLPLYNESKAELIDIRVETETAVWQLNFGLKIPADKIPENLDKLPKDKLIVVACPTNHRSTVVDAYLVAKGFNAVYLEEGLLALMARLRGGKVKDITL